MAGWHSLPTELKQMIGAESGELNLILVNREMNGLMQNVVNPAPGFHLWLWKTRLVLERGQARDCHQLQMHLAQAKAVKSAINNNGDLDTSAKSEHCKTIDDAKYALWLLGANQLLKGAVDPRAYGASLPRGASLHELADVYIQLGNEYKREIQARPDLSSQVLSFEGGSVQRPLWWDFSEAILKLIKLRTVARRQGQTS